MSKMFEPMVNIIPEGAKGNVKVEHFEIGAPSLRMMFRPQEMIAPGRYVQLLVNGGVMMSDTQMEQRSNMGVVSEARGDVLIAGLGLGMVLVPILRKPEVRTVTVIEKNENVIDLILPAIVEKVPQAKETTFTGKGFGGVEETKPKLDVVVGDIFDWQPPKGAKWDVIYFDIWAEICEDNLDEMEKLHRKFARRKKKDGWMDSWQKEYLLYQRRRRSR